MELFGLCSLYRPPMTQILIHLFPINMIIFLPTGFHGDNPSGTTQVICILDMYDTPLSFQKCFRISSSQESFFPLPLLADGVRIKVSSVSKLVLVLNFSPELSLFAKLCEYVFIRSLPCLNSITENVVDWNACVKILACMLKWSVWCGWISGWFWICRAIARS